MELYTTGIKYHTAVQMPFSVNPMEDFKTFINLNSRYKIHLLEKGNALINLNKKKILIKSPSLFCLNETDVLSIINQDDVTGKTVYFHPGVVNAKFRFDVLNSPDGSLSQTDNLDLFILHQFIENNKSKCFSLNQIVFKRIQGLFDAIFDMLTVQNDEFWPCKSRAYLIELLFLIRRIYEDAGDVGNIGLENADENINNIILYLHSNYGKKITIKNLTRYFSTNRTSLSELFKGKTGMTIMEYLRKIRVDVACQMLRNTSCDSQEIMDRTGFTDLSNFGKVFKKNTGYNPSRYRSSFSRPINYKN